MLVLPKKRAKASLYDVMGNEVRIQNDSCLLASTPCYFVSESSPAEVADIFSQAKITGTVQYELRTGFGNLPSGKPAVLLGLRNLTDQSLSPRSFKVKTSGAFQGESVMRFGSIAQLKIQTAASPLVFADGNSATISVSEKNPLVSTKPTVVFPELRKPVSVDGKISPGEYGSPIISMEHPKFSANLHGGWTADSSCFAVTVKDNMLRPAPSGKPIYTGDSVELYFDFAPEKSIFATKYHSSAIRAVIAPSSPPRIVFDRDGIEGKFRDFQCFDPNALQCAYSRTSEGYILEIRFPMKERLYDGKIIGFNLQCVNAGELDRRNNIALNWCGKRCWDNIRNLGIAVMGKAAGH